MAGWLFRRFALVNPHAMGHMGAQPFDVARQRPQRREHDAMVRPGAIANLPPAPEKRARRGIMDQRHGAIPRGIQPHFDCPVPRRSETVRAGPRAQMIGRPRRTADAARRVGDDAALGQRGDERHLRIRRPSARAALERDRGEVEKVGRVGHDREHGMGGGL